QEWPGRSAGRTAGSAATRRWPTRAPSWRRASCRCRPISRTGSAMRRPTARRPCAARRRRGWSGAPSRTRRGARRMRSSRPDAAPAARALPIRFLLTARAENFLHGRPDLEDTLRRLKAFAAAGADVLYAPGLSTREQIVAVVQAVAPKPVNLLASPALGAITVTELGALGVKRISVGGVLARAAYSAALRAAREMAGRGPLRLAPDAAPLS